MLEKLLLRFEDNYNFVFVFLSTFFLSLVIGFFTVFTFNHPYVLIGLSSLALSYPVVSHLLREEEEVSKVKGFRNSLIFLRKEVFLYLIIFFGLAAGFFVLFLTGLVRNVEVYSGFVGDLGGSFLASDLFFGIWTNNLLVGALTFTLSLLFFSGFLFVLAWNASILSYYFSVAIGDRFVTFIAIFPHLFFELSGFIFAGLAGNMLMYGVQYDKNKAKFVKLCLFFLVLAFLSISLGAFLEIL